MKETKKKTSPTDESQTVHVSAEMRVHPALLRLREKLKTDLERRSPRTPE